MPLVIGSAYSGNGGKSSEIFKGLDKILKSKAQYHPLLKVIAYRKKNDGENFAAKRMFGYLCEQAGPNKDKLHELESQKKYLIHFPHLQGFFMENFGGYKKI